METLNKELVKKIQALPVPKDILNIDVGVIPLGKSILASRVKGGERKVGNLIMPDSVTTQEFVARIMAVGPEVSSYLKPGLLVIYNSMANMESIIKGVPYLCFHESSVFYIITDEEIKVTVAPESPEQKRRNSKIQTQAKTIKRVAVKQANDEDKHEEKRKSRKRTIFPITNKRHKK